MVCVFKHLSVFFVIIINNFTCCTGTVLDSVKVAQVLGTGYLNDFCLVKVVSGPWSCLSNPVFDKCFLICIVVCPLYLRQPPQSPVGKTLIQVA